MATVVQGSGKDAAHAHRQHGPLHPWGLALLAAPHAAPQKLWACASGALPHHCPLQWKVEVVMGAARLLGFFKGQQQRGHSQ